MLKNTLFLALALISFHSNANIKPTSLKTASTTQVVELQTLRDNCDAIKEMAKTAIELRYLKTTLPAIYEHADQMFPSKNEATYKNLFKMIAKDAQQEPIFKHEINIKKEKKAFVDRNYTLCMAAYSEF